MDKMAISGGLATLPRAPPPPKKVQISGEQQPLLISQPAKDTVMLGPLRKSALKSSMKKNTESMQELKV